MSNEAKYLHVHAVPRLSEQHLPLFVDIYSEIPKSKRGLVDSFLRTSINAIFYFATLKFKADFMIKNAEICDELPSTNANVYEVDLMNTFGRLIR